MQIGIYFRNYANTSIRNSLNHTWYSTTLGTRLGTRLGTTPVTILESWMKSSQSHWRFIWTEFYFRLLNIRLLEFRVRWTADRPAPFLEPACFCPFNFTTSLKYNIFNLNFNSYLCNIYEMFANIYLWLNWLFVYLGVL